MAWPERGWVRVELPHAVFGLRTEGGHVVEAAPIARWAVGKAEHVVARYLVRKGATFQRLNIEEET